MEKRSGEGGLDPPVAKKQKRTYTKRKSAKDSLEAKAEDSSAAPKNLLSFDEFNQVETDQLINDVSARRMRNKDPRKYPQLQLLSEWRLFQEIARQQKPDGESASGLAALRGDSLSGSKRLLGFDPDLLDVLQLGATSHLRDIVIGASRFAQQRRLGSQKAPGFTVVEDVRIGLGEIRKRDEDEAARIREMENELTLKQAAHKSADDELREKAKSLKEQRAGEQAAAAANKALAATLGGGKWDKWGVGGSVAKTTPKAEDAGGLASDPGRDVPANGTLHSNSQYSGINIEVGDIVAFLETQPEYANSQILFKLMNLRSMT
jgi:hypothetical protein